MIPHKEQYRKDHTEEIHATIKHLAHRIGELSKELYTTTLILEERERVFEEWYKQKFPDESK